jgi:hypothetical protein
MLTALTWLTPDQLEWAGLGVFLAGCFICAHFFCVFLRRWVAAGKELDRQLSVDEHAAQALAVVCPLCRPWGVGTCTCSRDCRHGDCRFGEMATLSFFTPEDLRAFPGLAPRRRGRRGKRKAGTR